MYIGKFILESMIYVIFAILRSNSSVPNSTPTLRHTKINTITVDIVLHIRTYRQAHLCVCSLFAIQFQMNYTSIVLFALCYTVTASHTHTHSHYFNFKWVGVSVCDVRAIHRLPFVKNHFDFDTHFGLTDGQKVWKLKIYYQSFICVMCVACWYRRIHLSFVYGLNQMKSIDMNVNVVRVRYNINTTFDRWTITRYPCLFANDHHFSMCVLCTPHTFIQFAIRFHKWISYWIS